MPYHPTTIRLKDHATLTIEWSDGHGGPLSLRTLRDECPCAGCKGESVLFQSYTPPPQPELPGKYELVKAEPVGHYALQLTWKDGHATGIYTWGTLRALCQCGECTAIPSGRQQP